MYNLLTPEEVESYMLSHGITKDTKVILYGEDVSGVGRVAYAYLWAGVEDVKVLNGGLKAWENAGYELETEVNEGTKAESFGTTVPAHPSLRHIRNSGCPLKMRKTGLRMTTTLSL